MYIYAVEDPTEGGLEDPSEIYFHDTKDAFAHALRVCRVFYKKSGFIQTINVLRIDLRTTNIHPTREEVCLLLNQDLDSLRGEDRVIAVATYSIRKKGFIITRTAPAIDRGQEGEKEES